MSERRTVWDKHAIKAEIYRRGQTMRGLAEKHGMPEASLRVSLITPFPKGDKVIARFFGLPLHELWPDRYDTQGNRFTFVNEPTRFGGGRTSQKHKGVSDRRTSS